MSLDVLYARCAGLDLHKRTVVACRIMPGPGGRAVREVRTFGTMTAELLDLGDWLEAGGVTHIAMESTGVYLKPGLEPVRGALCVTAGQCRPRESGAWAQARCGRCGVTGRSAAAWVVGSQLRA